MQLTFFKEIFDSKDVQNYLDTRAHKYNNQEAVVKQFKYVNIITLPYFGRWLSGFIEAEGCFSFRKTTGVLSFSIGQNNDLY
jgi:hypothetical protein